MAVTGPAFVSGSCDAAFLNRSVITLDDSREPLGEIRSAARLPDGSVVVVATPTQVMLFDRDGAYVRMIGAVGPGPYEYTSPSLVRTDGDRIGVWDEGSLKLIIYDGEGRPEQAFNGVGSAVADFQFRGDSAYFYQSGGAVDAFVSGYNLDTAARHLRVGDGTVEHALLMMLRGSGTLALGEDHLYFASPAAADVLRRHLESPRTDAFTIDDASFSVARSGFSTLAEINAGMDRATAFGMHNSRFYKLQPVERGLLAVLQHGRVDYGGRRPARYDRHLNVHLIDPGGRQLSCERIDLDLDRTGDDPIVGSTDRGFLMVEMVADGYDWSYRIVELYAD